METGDEREGSRRHPDPSEQNRESEGGGCVSDPLGGGLAPQDVKWTEGGGGDHDSDRGRDNLREQRDESDAEQQFLNGGAKNEQPDVAHESERETAHQSESAESDENRRDRSSRGDTTSQADSS